MTTKILLSALSLLTHPAPLSFPPLGLTLSYLMPLHHSTSLSFFSSVTSPHSHHHHHHHTHHNSQSPFRAQVLVTSFPLSPFRCWSPLFPFFSSTSSPPQTLVVSPSPPPPACPPSPPPPRFTPINPTPHPTTHSLQTLSRPCKPTTAGSLPSAKRSPLTSTAYGHRT